MESGGLAAAESGDFGEEIFVIVSTASGGGGVMAEGAPPKRRSVRAFMKTAAEKASLRMWDQLSPIEKPLHLNLVTYKLS